jgi:hypothetical protein
MPFRDRFDCLWCGEAWTTRAPSDLEGWAQLCPTCLGKAGANPFLRARLKQAMSARAAANPTRPAAGESTAVNPAPPSPSRPLRPAPAPAPALPDDWFLRRGPFEHGAIHDTAWTAELDMVTRWLDARPLRGVILEPAAGVGFFSPLLADKGELHASDADGPALDRARDRLVAHRLLAHLHVRDPWSAAAPGEQPADAAVLAFLIGRVRGAGLDTAFQRVRDRLRAGADLALVNLHPDPQGGPPDGLPWTYHEPAVLEAALVRAGFAHVIGTSTGRFFSLVSAVAA